MTNTAWRKNNVLFSDEKVIYLTSSKQTSFPFPIKRLMRYIAGTLSAWRVPCVEISHNDKLNLATKSFSQMECNILDCFHKFTFTLKMMICFSKQVWECSHTSLKGKISVSKEKSCNFQITLINNWLAPLKFKNSKKLVVNYFFYDKAVVLAHRLIVIFKANQ